MNRLEYIDKKFVIEQKIDSYYQRRQEIEFEYLVKRSNDPRWIRYGALVEKLKEQLERLKQEYDDNRVYRTSERQLATRVDGTTMRRKATLYENIYE